MKSFFLYPLSLLSVLALVGCVAETNEENGTDESELRQMEAPLLTPEESPRPVPWYEPASSPVRRVMVHVAKPEAPKSSENQQDHGHK